MNCVTRRNFLSGTASLALLGTVSRPAIGRCTPYTGELRDRMRDLAVCAKRYRELDAGDIVDPRTLKAWQTSYDCMCAAADAVRYAITDETIGRDAAIEFARRHVWPTCDRAILYWQPLSGLSPSYRPLTSAFSVARAEVAQSYASSWPQLDDPFPPVRNLIEATRAIRGAIPLTLDDRRAARRVIESLNNDDMVDVSIVRSTMMDEALKDFASWARPCGAFTCQRCNEWLGREEEDA